MTILAHTSSIKSKSHNPALYNVRLWLGTGLWLGIVVYVTGILCLTLCHLNWTWGPKTAFLLEGPASRGQRSKITICRKSTLCKLHHFISSSSSFIGIWQLKA